MASSLSLSRRLRGIDQFAVHPSCERGTRQPRSDRLSDLGHGDRPGEALSASRLEDECSDQDSKTKPRVERRFACVSNARSQSGSRAAESNNNSW